MLKAGTERERPLLIYDGQCQFCIYCVEYARAATGSEVDYQPYQAVQQDFPDIDEGVFRASIQLVHTDGSVTKGARAAFGVLALGHYTSFWEFCYNRLPPFGTLSERCYRLVARHRVLFHRLGKLLFGPSPRPGSLSLTSWLFLRLLALVYFFAFVSFAVQAPGLIGEQGILPAASYFEAVDANYGLEKYWLLPSLFWLDASDAAIGAVGLAGILLSGLLLVNVFPRSCLIGLYILYLTILNGGQVFMYFQWDILLLECGFLAIFLPSRPVLFTWLYRLLLFRFMLQSGLVKLLSGDEHWRGLTALNYHFETQPLPTALAWYAHKLPELVLQAGLVFTFVVELLVPFLILMPRRPRQLAAIAIAVFQLTIIVTGSYNYFNFLTLCLCLLLLDDQFLSRMCPAFIQRRSGSSALAPVAWVRSVVPVTCALVYLLLSSILLSATGHRSQLSTASRALLSWSAPLHIANSYGLFAVMTTRRPEIIIEGSVDGNEWLAYQLPYKPGALERPPVWATPHQPRLDWQLWFAALAPAEQNPWLKGLVVGLLTGSEPILALFEYNPFPGAPPSFIRASLYQYHFSNWQTRRQTGHWWTREFDREFMPPTGFKVKVGPAQWPSQTSISDIDDSPSAGVF